MLNNSKAQIIKFPIKKPWLPETEVEDVKTRSKRDYDQDIKEELSENKDYQEFLDETLKNYKLPPFVHKMRQIGSISQQLDLVEKLSLELEYYLNEIELYTKNK